MSEAQPPPLRVLLLVASEDDGGAARSSYLLARHLPEFGVESHVVVHRAAPLTRWLSEAAIPWTRLPELIETGMRAPGDLGGIGALIHHGRRMPRLVRRLAELAEREHARVLYGQGTWTNYVGAAAARFMNRRTQRAATVWHIRGDHSARHLRVAARLFARLTPLAAVVAVSRFAARPYAGLTCPLHVVANGVDWCRVEAARADRAAQRIFGLGSEAIIVGYAGRFVPKKGLAILVDAAIAALASVPALHFVILGDTPAYAGDDVRAAIQARFAAAGLDDRVHLPGYVADVEPLLAGLDLLAVPSICGDACPRSAVEALAVGVPVIGSDIGGIPELIESGVNGLLVPPGDASRLAAAIVDLARAPDTRRSMAAAARHRARQQFDAREVARKVATVLRAAAPT